ncbi:hypothetical protein BU15DRAFT_55577 [Melanogaster broomeanus]|nr:hypothetical protein BU15DRAFT_55577 [Melanogaster broomeanus]
MDAETDEESQDENGDGDHDNNSTRTRQNGRNYSIEHRLAPSIEEAQKALVDLRQLLKPRRADGTGYTDPKLNRVLLERLERMREFLWLYTDVCSDGTPHATNPVGGHWSQAADRAARNAGKTHGDYLSRYLRNWSKAYIKNREALPLRMKSQTLSRIDDESLAADLKLHLQSVGKFNLTQDLVDYLSLPENQMRHGFKETISLKTAQRWMKKMGYRWKMEPKGQYADGHEREDVVYYRQNVFLPAWNRYLPRMRRWKNDDPTIEDIVAGQGRPAVVWFHDESTFYANDRRKLRWVISLRVQCHNQRGKGCH